MEDYMAEQDVTRAETTEEQGEGQDERQAVTAEQLAELQRQLEETRKAQSGSDRTVAELRKALEQKEQEAANAEKSAQQKAEERIAEIEKKLQQAEADKQRATQRGLAQQLLSDEGIKAPSFLDRLVGSDNEETEAAVNEYIESIKQTKLSAADEYAKKNGRKVTNSEGDAYSHMSYKEMAGLSNEEFAKIPKDVVQKALSAELGQKE